MTTSSRITPLVLLALLWTLPACRDSSRIRNAALLAASGQRVCANAQEFYRRLDDHLRLDRMLQQRIRVLTHPKPSAGITPAPQARFEIQLDERVEAFAALEAVYREVSLLATRSFAKPTQKAVDSIGRSFKRLTDLPDLPKELIGQAGRLSGRVLDGLKAAQLARVNRDLIALTDGFRRLWDLDRRSWQDVLDRIELDLADVLETVPEDRFDEKRLAREVDMPFTHPINVALYKLRLRHITSDRRRNLEDGQSALSLALRSLVALHGDFDRRPFSQENWRRSLQAIDRALLRFEDLTPEAR